MCASPALREVIVPPTRAGEGRQATTMRGTLLANSLAILREHHREPEYFRLLPASLHEQVRTVLSQSWVAMPLMVTHYGCMGQLYPSALEQIENGRMASERTQNAYLRTVVRALQAAGTLDVPSALKRLPFALERLVAGGGATAVYRTGPKDVRVELLGFPFVGVQYARNAWQGMFESSVALMTRRAFVRQDERFANAERMALMISWV